MTVRSNVLDPAASPVWRAKGVVFLAVLATGVEIGYVGFGTGAGWLLLHLPGLLLAVVIGDVWLVGSVVGIAGLPFLTFLGDWSPTTAGADLWTAVAARWLVLSIVARTGLGWRSAERLAQIAVERDPLTGLLNNPGFRRRVDEERSRLDRGGGPFTLMVLDLDGFKGLNDTRGHVVGDRCLSYFAEVLDTATRRHDLVGRLGGDEFAVLLPNTNAAQAETAIARLQSALVDALTGRGWEVTFSLGAVTFDTPPESVDAALAEADGRMYAAKRSVRGLIEEPSDR